MDFQVQAGDDDGSLPASEEPSSVTKKKQNTAKGGDEPAVDAEEEKPIGVLSPIGEAYAGAPENGGRTLTLTEQLEASEDLPKSVPHPSASSEGPRSHRGQVREARRLAVQPNQLSVTDRMRLAYG